ncbi:hypothetical protein M8818_000444 [Zalaria obscura]|uniref:Uncharacterized protein n=1 Tax=Zalaria obscura TaxID=2024903 RepID=A0ACC3SMV6_9PEZI
MSSPFPPTASAPGKGIIDLALLPPCTPVLRSVSYQYPLKLISPTPITVDPSHAKKHTGKALNDTSALSSADHGAHLVHTVFLLTYGGGLVAGDSIFLTVTLAPTTRLVLLTQGSTKIFKSPSSDVVTRQTMGVDVDPGAALVYLPDPVQPFERSAFEQKQIYNILLAEPSPGETVGRKGSLCVLDWVSCGRRALGEDWDFYRYGSRNEIYLVKDVQKRLLLRDNILLDTYGEDIGTLAPRMDGLQVFGTLILYGPLFTKLAAFFMDEFKALPRIGGRNWDTNSEAGSGDEPDEEEVRIEVWRRGRQRREVVDGLLWTAASVRGCVVVKFGAREVEGGRTWLRSMLDAEGSVVGLFGERALLCLN